MSSKRAIRRRSCQGKRAYACEPDARASLKKHPRRWGWMVPYRCAFCRQFHLGHPPRKVRDSIASNAAARVIQKAVKALKNLHTHA